MPTLTKKYHGKGGKLVIINLQPTKQDKKADLIIKTFADSVLEKLFAKLGIDIPEYDPAQDPIVSVKSLEFLDWTQSGKETKRVVALASKIETEFKEKRNQPKNQSQK
jgi:mono-ADP-ribosyltransferase sirtuin 6